MNETASGETGMGKRLIVTDGDQDIGRPLFFI
jgi:hypothetical protein